MDKLKFTQARDEYDKNFEGDVTNSDDGYWHAGKLEGFDVGYSIGHAEGVAVGLERAAEMAKIGVKCPFGHSFDTDIIARELRKQAADIRNPKHPFAGTLMDFHEPTIAED